MGPVDFSNNGVLISGCTSLPVANGVAVCNTKFPQLGTLTITANYSGDLNIKPSTSSLQLTLAKVLANVYVAATPATPVFGVPVSVNALLLGADGAPAPTGTVTFFEVNAASATLSSLPVGSDGRASLVLPSAALAPLNAGTHSILAKYSGDVNYQASEGKPLALVVGKAATSVAVASTPPQVGQPLTLKAAVTVVPAGIAAPGGSVTFNLAGKPIAGCSALPLQSGVANCKTSLTQLGDYAIAANYSGDGNTEANTGTLQLTVGKAVVGVYTAAAPAVPVFGAPVIISALVLGATGLANPGGTITFSEGAEVQGTSSIGADGRASLALPANGRGPVKAGQHTFMAVYNGDAVYASSTPTELKLPVDKAATSTSLTATSGTAITAMVSVVAPGAGTPSGTVQFSQNGASIGTAPLVQTGSTFGATLATKSQSGSILAVYPGDANFGTSTSAPLAVTASTKMTISAGDAATAGTVTFTIQVTAPSGAPIPGGTVKLSSDAVSVGMGTLASGKATIAAKLAAGSHTIIATYSGDAVYPASTTTIQQVVGAGIAGALTLLSLTSSQGTTVSGQPVTFTVQLPSSADTGWPELCSSWMAPPCLE